MHLLKSFNDRRVAKGAAKAVENNKWSQIQAGHDAGAFAPGRNVDWSPTAGQKAAESQATFNTGTW
jgi:hypothetical protein